MALRFEGVEVAYGSKRVLKDLWLDVPEGAVTGFLGHNGAGKTTAMRVALGLIRPRAGRVLVDGFDASQHPREARARMAGLIEVPRFQESRGGLENLVELARLGGLSRADALREATHRLEQVGLASAAQKHVGAYSQGMRQRLGIAQALLGRPRVLLLDEPTNGLDPEGIEDIRKLVRGLVASEGCAVLLSSHLLAEVSGVCDRIAVLRDGHLVVQGERHALLASSGSRYVIEVEARERAVERAGALGIALSPAESRGGAARFRADLGAHAPSSVARALVDAGLVAFQPEPEDLGALYRRASAGELPPSPPGTPAQARAPQPRIAPARPLARVVAYDLRRLLRAGAWALVVPPVLVAGVVIARRAFAARSLAADVEAGRLATTTDVTAFEAFGRAVAAGLPIAAFLVLGLASQLVASEHARGSLRNVLLRPVERAHVALGKAIVTLLAALVTCAVLVGSAWAGAALFFDFTDVTEVLPNGQRFAIVPAEELWPEMRRALSGVAWPVVAYGAIGLAIGSLVRAGAGALAAALGFVIGLDLVRLSVRGGAAEPWFPGAFLPSPLGDTSAMRSFALFAEGVTNAPFRFGGSEHLVPWAWAFAAVVVTVISMQRRDVP